MQVLKIYDYILGYTCISKTKVNMIKEIESNGYTRRQLYNCLNDNKDNIKKYMDEKNILEEYSKLKYIDTVIRAKIKDSSEGLNSTINISSNICDVEDCLEETDEEIFNRLDKYKEKDKETLMDIIRRINRGGN